MLGSFTDYSKKTKIKCCVLKLVYYCIKKKKTNPYFGYYMNYILKKFFEQVIK